MEQKTSDDSLGKIERAIQDKTSIEAFLQDYCDEMDYEQMDFLPDVLSEEQEPSIVDRNLKPLRFQTPEKRSLTDMYLKELKENPLFEPMGECCCSPGVEPSITVTGFGMRNLPSLQRALWADELAKQKMEKHDVVEEEELVETSTSYTTSSTESNLSTQTESIEGSTIDLEKKRLEYLMGLETAADTGEEYAGLKGKLEVIPEEEEQGKYPVGGTVAMRTAQRYLRSHKIFEFFQFLITLLLSARPDNPIAFLLEILSKLLLYRSGIGYPVVLYEKKHLEQLFNLMDRMRTGFIEVEQYETGMKTLGICIYSKDPPLNEDCMVSKDFFVEEGFECQLDIVNDLIYSKAFKLADRLVNPPPSKADLKTIKSGSTFTFGSPFVVDHDFYNFMDKKKPRTTSDLLLEVVGQEFNN